VESQARTGRTLLNFSLRKVTSSTASNGVLPRSKTDRIDDLYPGPEVSDRKLILHYGDLTDSMNITRIIQEVQPDEISNLGAM
jgi:GDP-D-mannose dehydratase